MDVDGYLAKVSDRGQRWVETAPCLVVRLSDSSLGFLRRDDKRQDIRYSEFKNLQHC